MKIATLPLSLFTVIMGLAGYMITGRTFSLLCRSRALPNSPIFSVVLVIFLLMLIAFSIKLIRYPKTIKRDWEDPVHINLFPTISISFLLLSIANQDIWPNVSWYFWLIGTILHSIFSIAVIKTWIEKTHFAIEHLNTLWFIPIVGNILVPIMGTQYGYIELSWFFFAIGFSFWILLMPLIMYRLFFVAPLPKTMAPSLFILIAPPAAGFISYYKLTHQIDALAHILLYLALFFFIFNVIQALHRGFGKQITLSWWATVFPSTALATALCVMYHATNINFFLYLAQALLIGIGLWGSLLIRGFIYRPLEKTTEHDHAGKEPS